MDPASAATPVLHAAESAELANGWHDVARKTRLVERLARITEQHIVRAFSCSLAVEDYEDVPRERRPGVTTGLYGLCAGLLVARVRRGMTERHPDDLTLFVFEDGDVDHRKSRESRRRIGASEVNPHRCGLAVGSMKSAEPAAFVPLKRSTCWRSTAAVH